MGIKHQVFRRVGLQVSSSLINTCLSLSSNGITKISYQAENYLISLSSIKLLEKLIKFISFLPSLSFYLSVSIYQVFENPA